MSVQIVSKEVKVDNFYYYFAAFYFVIGFPVFLFSTSTDRRIYGIGMLVIGIIFAGGNFILWLKNYLNRSLSVQPASYKPLKNIARFSSNTTDFAERIGN